MNGPSSNPASRLRSLLLAAAAGLLAATILAQAAGVGTRFVTEIFFYQQDIFVLFGFVVLFLGLALRAGRVQGGGLPPPFPPSLALALACAAALLAFAGHWVVFRGYALSRDEAMVLFDATILRAGALLAVVPEAWRDFVPALEPVFRFQIADNAAWFSAYLPGNAALHALFGVATGPLLVAASVLLARACALRLWRDRPDAALVAALMIACSPQVVVTAMTPYAATAHMALNFFWLWMFLRGGRGGHAAAMATGFVATGLHQIVFHPLFAAPFIGFLWLRRRWRLAFAYTCAYAAICFFWLVYWRLVLAANGLSPGVQDFSDLTSRIRLLLQDFEWQGSVLMLKNALRFVSWMVPVLLPFLFGALASIRTWRDEEWALAGGLILTTVLAFVLLPYQGHGWGYRYWSGLLVNFVLLAAGGYVRLTPGPMLRAGFSMAMLAAVLSAVVLLPLRAWQAHVFAAPYERAWRAVSSADMQAVIVDPSNRPSLDDIVRNDPFLRNRPKILLITRLDEAEVARLCAQGPVGVLDSVQAEAAGVQVARSDQAVLEHAARLRAFMVSRDCARPVPVSP
jgi:hypothetical protein